MADNVLVTNPAPNSDYTVASDEVQVGGTNPLGEVQFVKLVDGTLNGTAPIPGSSNGLKVDLSGTAVNATAIKVDGSAVTQPISGSVTATISGAVQALDEMGVLVSAQAHRYNITPHLLVRNVEQERQLDVVMMLLQDVAMSLRQIAADTVSGRGISSPMADTSRGVY